MAKSSVFKACLKAVTVLVDRQLYGSEFHTKGELRLKDFADIARDIPGIVSSSLLEDRSVYLHICLC